MCINCNLLTPLGHTFFCDVFGIKKNVWHTRLCFWTKYLNYLYSLKIDRLYSLDTINDDDYYKLNTYFIENHIIDKLKQVVTAYDEKHINITNITVINHVTMKYFTFIENDPKEEFPISDDTFREFGMVDTSFYRPQPLFVCGKWFQSEIIPKDVVTQWRLGDEFVKSASLYEIELLPDQVWYKDSDEFIKTTNTKHELSDPDVNELENISKRRRI